MANPRDFWRFVLLLEAVLLLESGLASRERSCTISGIILISFLLAVLLLEQPASRVVLLLESGLASLERSCFSRAVLLLESSLASQKRSTHYLNFLVTRYP